MNRSSLPILGALAAGLALVAGAIPAAAAPNDEKRLVKLERATPLREYAGTLLFSRWDGSAYRLATYRDGEVRDLAVPPQAKPLDADIGPDSSGRPSVAVSLCAGSCDLFVLGLQADAQLRPVRNANTTGRDETDPSVWKGRLTFAREYGSKIVPYTKRLRAPRSRPSDRLAGLPGKRCGAIEPPSCRPLENPELVQMELYGSRVGQSWTYQPDNFPGFRQNEIRLTNVTRTDTRQIASMTTGLGGQSYLGPSLAEGHVAFFRACQGDPGGCSTDNSGAIRYRISDDTYDLVGANEAWTAWAWSGDAGFHVPSALACGEGVPNPPGKDRCGIYRRADLPWRDVDAERIR